MNTEPLPPTTHDSHPKHAIEAREKSDPVHSTATPVPFWIVAGICLLSFWAGAYLMTYSGGFNGLYYDSTAWGSPNAAGGAAKAEDPIALGEKFFTQTCVTCHQKGGTGQAGLYPPLAGSEYVQGDEHRLAAIVLHGVQGPITVAGQKVNSQMQAWGTTLSDKKIAYITTYIRQAWGNKAAPITPQLVAEVRKATASRTTAWTEAELKAFK